MPGKRNARTSERICGLSAVVQGYADMVASLVGDQWNEGDVSCSVVRRVALPGAFLALDGQLEAVLTVLDELAVFDEAIAAELHANLPTLTATRMLMAAVGAGAGREEAHRIISEHVPKADGFFAAIADDERLPLTDDDVEAVKSNILALVGAAPDHSRAFCVSSQATGRPTPHRRRLPTGAHPVNPNSPNINLPAVHSGKVRDIFDAGDNRLLMITSDRISAFDVVMDEPVPDKGRVLTAMSAYWFETLADVLPSHLISTEVADLPPEAQVDGVAGRAMLCHRADMLPIECIVRGYISGSAWKEYQAQGTMHGQAPPRRAPGVRQAARTGVHPLDQGRVGPRREHLLRPSGGAGGPRSGRAGPVGVAGAVPPGG